MFPDLTRDDVFRLETRRLWLRWPRHADAAAVAALAGERAVAEMLATIPHPYPPGEAERFILRTRGSNAEGRSLDLAITPLRQPGTLIGVVGARPVGEGVVEAGFWLGTPHWGRGFATEALRALADAIFSYTEFEAIDSAARVINPASRRVHEKCGFTYRGSGFMELKARGGLFPVDRFRLDRGTWAGLKAWGQTGLVPQPADCEAPGLCAAH